MHCMNYLLGHACPTRARTGMSDQMSDMGVRWVVEPPCRICLFEQNSDNSARQVLERRGRPPVGLARPHCSRAVRLEQSSGHMVGQPCPRRLRTRLSDKLPPVGLWCPTGVLVGQSCPTTLLSDCSVRCLSVRQVRTRRTCTSDEFELAVTDHAGVGFELGQAYRGRAPRPADSEVRVDWGGVNCQLEA